MLMALRRTAHRCAARGPQPQAAEFAPGAVEDPPEVYLAGLHANALLEGLAEVLIGWLLIQHAEIALEAIGDAGDADRDFYVGKVASARWFAKTVLPRAALRRSLAEAETGALMDLPDAAF